MTEVEIAAYGVTASRMMAHDQTRFDAACEVMRYLREAHAPYYYLHRMSTVLHGNAEGTAASRAPDNAVDKPPQVGLECPVMQKTLTEKTMTEYHKIQSIYKRDMTGKRKTLIEGEWTLPEFEYLAGNAWTFTEKVDGTNIRVIFKDGGITFGGRTEDAQIPAKLVERLNERFLPLAAKLGEVFTEGAAVLYGEGYGAKIQKGGGNYRADQDFVLFDVRVGPWWLQRADVEDVAQKLGIDVVPVIGEGTLHDAVAWAKRGIRSTWGDFEAEGIVARPKTELNTRAGHRLVAKIKCRDFSA